LIGFMGAGKSTVGRTLAEHLGWTFEDLDERIEQREGMSVPEIFRDSGEAGFRRAEHAALKAVLDELGAGAERVVALGGGAFVQSRNARQIKAANVPTIFLDADADELWRRCLQQAERQGTERPLLGTLEGFRDLCKTRRRYYLKAALKQDTSGKSVMQIAAEIARVLGLTRSEIERGEK
jgi:shikimate kinase